MLELIKHIELPDNVQQLLNDVRFKPNSRLGKFIRTCFSSLPMEQVDELVRSILATTVMESSLKATHIRWDDKLGIYVRDNYGVVSRKVITTAGVGFLVDAWQNSLELEIMKYHGVGTGTNAEASGDTALQTESTTALNPDSTRATGSLTEGATANIFRTVGTVTFDASAAITEHGILSQAATGGGTLWDRSVFSAVNVASGDSIQFTYDMTASAGG